MTREDEEDEDAWCQRKKKRVRSPAKRPTFEESIQTSIVQSYEDKAKQDARRLDLEERRLALQESKHESEKQLVHVQGQTQLAMLDMLKTLPRRRRSSSRG